MVNGAMARPACCCMHVPVVLMLVLPSHGCSGNGLRGYAEVV